ncbi:MAG: SufE family protein [Bernardetiaceae bacterium]
MTHTDISAIQEEIIEEFALFDNDQDKYSYLIDLGKQLPPLTEAERSPENIVKGCQSKVWLVTDLDEQMQQIIYRADSDALIVKGLIGLLLRVFSGQSPQAILEAEVYFIEKIGLNQMLSMTRSNGLAAMLKQIKRYALAYQSKVD